MRRTIEIDEKQQAVLMAALRFWQWYQWECREPKGVDDFDQMALRIAREHSGNRLLSMRTEHMDRLYRKIRGRQQKTARTTF